MVDKTMIIVNPASANGRTGKNWPHMSSYLCSQGLEFDQQITNGMGDATLLARQALLDGYTTIVSVGGDGTLNETLNGFFFEDGLINPQAKLGVLFCGTGGDFIRTAGIPRDFTQAAARLRDRNSRILDIGRITFTSHSGERVTRHFLNVAGFGVDGEIVYRVNHTSKALGGFISFLYATVSGLLAYRCLPLKLEIDNQICYEGMFTVVAVGNGQFFGSGMQIVPMAKLDSGHFDIVLIEQMSKLELLRYLPSIYRGNHIKNPHARIFSGTVIRATSSQRVLVDVDGEQPGCLDAEFTIIPACLPVIL